MVQRTLRGRWSTCARPLILVTAVLVGCHYDEFKVDTSPPVLTIRELGLLPGGTESQANAGSATTIVGWATASGTGHHAVTFSGGQAHALQEPAGATSSEALGVNANGVIVGIATIGGDTNAVVWPTPSAAPILLPGLGGPYSFAAAINKNGEVVGQAQTGDAAHAVVLVTWEPTGSGYSVARIIAVVADTDTVTKVVTTDTFSVGQDYAPTALNDLGQIAGNLPESGDTFGFYWSREKFDTLTLETLDTIEAPGGAGSTDANGFNNYGVVVGAIQAAGNPSRGFLYTGALGAFQLGPPPGGYTDIEANAVNDSGRVAGNAFTADNLGNTLTSVAVIGTVLDSVHTFTTLPTLGGSRAQPTDNAITSCGVILGWATKSASPTIRYAVAWVPQGCSIP